MSSAQKTTEPLVKPTPGDERYTLYPAPRGSNCKHVIKRFVWTDTGTTSYYDGERKDFQTWPGSWVLIETLGPFADRDAATAFMRERKAA